MWCLEGKKLQTQSLEVHIDAILQALVHAIGNPMHFKTIVPKAMEAMLHGFSRLLLVSLLHAREFITTNWLVEPGFSEDATKSLKHG